MMKEDIMIKSIENNGNIQKKGKMLVGMRWGFRDGHAMTEVWLQLSNFWCYVD